jgi:hypothetical protein
LEDALAQYERDKALGTLTTESHADVMRDVYAEDAARGQGAA